MEALDFDKLTKERRKAIAQTIRPIDVPELKKLLNEIRLVETS